MGKVGVIGIVGIHTGIGKTIASAVIAEALGADYWKPVQSGIQERDNVLVASLITNGKLRVHEEAYLLNTPVSPHQAADIDKVTIDYKNLKWPETNKILLVETAGGLLSPMTGTDTMADFIQHYQLPVILVAQNYLGSINHTMLTIEVLKSRGINVAGIIFNGHSNEASESLITNNTDIPILGRIPHIDHLNADGVSRCADTIKQSIISNLTNLLNN